MYLFWFLFYFITAYLPLAAVAAVLYCVAVIASANIILFWKRTPGSNIYHLSFRSTNCSDIAVKNSACKWILLPLPRQMKW